jgi:hypothetical protein
VATIAALGGGGPFAAINEAYWNRIVPGLIAHNLARPDIRAGILDEVRAFLEVEGDRTLREILAEAGAVEAWRTETIAKAAPLVRTFAASAPFKAWIAAR